MQVGKRIRESQGWIIAKMKIKEKKRKKNVAKREVYSRKGVEGIFSTKKNGQKIKIYCAKREKIISTGKGMTRRRREDIHCKVREKEGLEDGKGGGEDERIFAKGKG
jgi:hypothetical protein